MANGNMNHKLDLENEWLKGVADTCTEHVVKSLWKYCEYK